MASTKADGPYPVTNIANPGGNDILCGRGGGTNAHSGNIKFRKLVAAHKLRYLAASKSDKPGVARDVVREWRAMDPPGRFLAKMDGQRRGSADEDDDKPTLWYDVGDKKAREKASQCLRERNGAANEAVAALVKTVTASGEACPEDYATLMNKAAMVKAQNELTIQQQQEMMKMGMQQQQYNKMMGQGMGAGMGAGMGMDMGGGGNYCQETNFDPLQQRNNSESSRFSPSGKKNFQDPQSTEDDLIEAEIQRLLHQRQRQLMARQAGGGMGGGGMGGGGMGGGGMGVGGGSMSNNRGGMGGGMGMSNMNGGNFSNDQPSPQPYMGEANVMREYEQLVQKQRELNVMAGKINDMMGGGNGGGMGNAGMMGMMSGGMNNMAGMMNGNNMNGMGGMMNGNNMGGMMSQAGNVMGNGGMGMNGDRNFGGGMQSNHNPDAAKDYMNRLRSLRQGGGGGVNNNQGAGGGIMSNDANMPDRAKSSSPSMFNNAGYSGNGGGNGGNDRNMSEGMGNGGGMMQGKGGGGSEFTIEEYQASLQQFLSHNDDMGGGSRRAAQHSGGADPIRAGGAMSGTCVQVATNLEDGRGGGTAGNKRSRRRSSLLFGDDMDLPMGRNTFKSVDSGVDRPSFQSMDDMDIRGTFKSVDTMDLMSIGNSINEIIEEGGDKNPDSKKTRRMSAAGRPKLVGGGASLSNFAQMAGETVEIRTMDHGRGSASGGRGGAKKKKGIIDPRLAAHAATRRSVQTKDCDGPSGGAAGGGGTRGSMISIKDFDLGDVDDGSRMSFGNMSIMSELTDFQEMVARGHGSAKFNASMSKWDDSFADN